MLVTDNAFWVETPIKASWPLAVLPLGLGLASAQLPLLRLLGALAARALERVDQFGAVQVFLVIFID